MNDWKEILEAEFKKEYFIKLSEFLHEENKKFTICPPFKLTFEAFKHCPLSDVKVVILGMDPYIGVNQAHGLSFSVPIEEAIPPSLRNIFKEINSNFGTNHTFTSGNLIPWAQQGVLLLNSILSVRLGESGSHRNKGWEQFTDTIISILNELDRPIVYLIWGNDAKKKKHLITNPKHLILESGHPSPLSCKLFFGNNHFEKTYDFHMINNIKPIDWIIK